jgi:hypothetical protein
MMSSMMTRAVNRVIMMDTTHKSDTKGTVEDEVVVAAEEAEVVVAPINHTSATVEDEVVVAAHTDSIVILVHTQSQE